MDTIFSVRNLLTSGCFLASIDLRDAYLHVPINIQYCRKSSPMIFTIIIAEALAPLRLRGISIVLYLDNLLLFCQNKRRSRRDEETLGESWLDHKQRQIKYGPVSDNKVSGVHHINSIQ